MTELELHRRMSRKESFLVAADNQFLGVLSSNKYMLESVTNEYGLYGSKYSSISIFNTYSVYGSQYNVLSPFNIYSKTPPRIILRGLLFGYLSVNRLFQNRIDPKELTTFIYNNGL